MGRVAVGGTPGAVGRVTLLLIKNKRRNVFFRALPSFLRSSLSLLPLYCAVNVNASMYPSSVLGAPFSSSLSSLLLLLFVVVVVIFVVVGLGCGGCGDVLVDVVVYCCNHNCCVCFCCWLDCFR